MRTIHTDEIIKNIKEMCIEANLELSEDMKRKLKNAKEQETGRLGAEGAGGLRPHLCLPQQQAPGGLRL